MDCFILGDSEDAKEEKYKLDFLCYINNVLETKQIPL